MSEGRLIQEASPRFPPEHCLCCGAEFQWGKSGQLVFYDAGTFYICYACGTEYVDKTGTLTIVWGGVMPEIQLVEEWATNTEIDWWNDCRQKLNKVIRKYNKWQTKKDFDAAYGTKLLVLVRHGKDTIGARDGGSGYRSLLDNMEKHILFVLN